MALFIFTFLHSPPAVTIILIHLKDFAIKVERLGVNSGQEEKSAFFFFKFKLFNGIGKSFEEELCVSHFCFACI